MKRISIIIGILIAVSAFGQQTSQFGNASFNPYLINPAAGGMNDVMQFEVTYRSQWTGYNGGPRTALIAGNSLINVGSKSSGLKEYNYEDKSFYKLPGRSAGKVKHVAGGIMYNDAIGPFSKTSVQGSYAVHLPLTKSINLGAGIGLGYSNLKVDESRVILYNEIDNAYSQFLGSTSSFNGIDASAGLVAYSENFCFGISTQQLLNNKINFNGTETESRLARHYFLNGSYLIAGSGSIAIEPNVVGKYTANSPLSLDAGIRLIYNHSSWLNVQYRTSNSLVLRVGSTLVKNLYIAYGYEVPTGKLAGAASGSHEIQLGIFIGNNRNLNQEIKDSNKQGGDGQTEE